MRLDDLLLLTPRLTPTEAQLFVLGAWSGDAQSPPLPTLSGRVIGPLCEYAETLRDRIPIVSMSWERVDQVRACARILEPCFWDPNHPFCYEVTLELWHGDRVADMRRLIAGLRHLEVSGLQLLLNGQPIEVDGVMHVAAESLKELEPWHAAECAAILLRSAPSICDRTDRWGPMVWQLLSADEADIRDKVSQLRNHPSLLMWVLPDCLTGDGLSAMIQKIRSLDRSRPIGRMVSNNEATIEASDADVLFLPEGHAEIGTTEPIKPYVVVAHDPGGNGYSPDSFANRIGDLRASVGSMPGVVGIVL